MTLGMSSLYQELSMKHEAAQLDTKQKTLRKIASHAPKLSIIHS